MAEIEFEVERSQFEKGGYVFGVCKGELPWPAKITKIDKENYHVKFINHRSVAVLNLDCIIAFNDRTCLKVMDQYKTTEKPTDKVFAAIKSCKN